ncbi:MAG: WD40 repeat domain-containing protein [Bacteroidetes bacterium]|jgi:WD40 repeat protein|nr:WD40 repeat domain-containing protein [Bacteroidota bacterium]
MRYLLAIALLVITLSFQDKGKKTILGKHGEMVNAVCFSPSGKVLVSGGNDNKVYAWNMDEKTEITSFYAHSIGVTSLAFTPDGTYLISAGLDNLIKVWRTDTWKLAHTLEGHTLEVKALAVSPSGQYLFSGGKDKVIRVWNLTDFTPMRTLEGHFDHVLSLSVSANGRYLASTGGDRVSKGPGNLKIWDLENWKMAYNLTGETYAVQTAKLNATGTMVLYAGNFGDAILLKWGEEKTVATAKITDYGVNSMALNGLQAYFGCAYNGMTANWNIGGDVVEWPTHESDINSVDLSPNKAWLASGGVDGRVILRRVNQ